MNQESYIQAALCNYLRANYPDVIFTSDLSGIRLPMKLAKQAKPLKSSRGIPDIIILQPAGPYHGLFIELKTTDAQLWRKDGTGPLADEHVAEQAAVIGRLQKLGFAAYFVRGFEAGRKLVDAYMRLLRSPLAGDALRTTEREGNHPLEWYG